MFNYTFFTTLSVEPPIDDISLGFKVTLLGTLQVFIGLILLVFLLFLFHLVSETMKRIKEKKPILDDFRKPKSDKTISDQLKPAFKLQIGRQPTSEEVAAIAAALYMQNIEMEAERRYIKSYKRRKQVLHAWKEASKFQLYHQRIKR